MKKIISIIFSIILIVAIMVALTMLRGCSLIGRGGNGSGDGDSNNPESVQIPNDVSDNETESNDNENNKVKIIYIKENKVTIGENEYSEKEEIKTALENINSDETEWIIEEEKAIQSTREMVYEIFDDLGLNYKK